ncbi:MAG: DNA adenine methylase [Eubacteriales bacterium]|nr:DNA adenine methylase [Eubacteriales bacterium]
MRKKILRLVKWTGSKARVVSVLVPLFPKGKKYIEPFAGSAATFLNNEQRYDTEILCELDKDLAMLHKVLSDERQTEMLYNHLKRVYASAAMFQYAKENLKYNGTLSDVERAVYKFIEIQLSFNGQGKNYSSSQTAEKFRQCVEKIPDIAKRYHGVQVVYGDGIELIQRECMDENTFIFADPPYLPELRGLKTIYACEMTQERHIYMLSVMKKAKCKIMLCGYADEKGEDLYDQELLPAGWRRYKVADLTQSCQSNGYKTKRNVASEFVWINYDLPSDAKNYIDVSDCLEWKSNNNEKRMTA